MIILKFKYSLNGTSVNIIANKSHIRLRNIASVRLSAQEFSPIIMFTLDYKSRCTHEIVRM